jgi:hypothetical protein
VLYRGITRIRTILANVGVWGSYKSRAIVEDLAPGYMASPILAQHVKIGKEKDDMLKFEKK